LEKGADKDLISRGLLANNWTKQDIEEGFNSINIKFKMTSPISDLNIQSNHLDTSVVESNHIALRVFVTVLGLFLLAGGVFGYFFRNDIPLLKNLIKSKNIPASEINQNLYTESQIKEEGVVEESAKNELNKEIGLVVKDEEKKDVNINDVRLVNEVIPAKIVLINCVDKVDCFISASKECTPAIIEEIKVLDFFGMIQTTKIKNTIEGLDSLKKCIFTTYVMDASLNYSSEIINQAKESGDTDEELKLQLDKSSESVKRTIGMLTKCSFPSSYLSQMLTRWKDGSFSSGDMGPGSCNTSIAQ